MQIQRSVGAPPSHPGAGCNRFLRIPQFLSSSVRSARRSMGGTPLTASARLLDGNKRWTRTC